MIAKAAYHFVLVQSTISGQRIKFAAPANSPPCCLLFFVFCFPEKFQKSPQEMVPLIDTFPNGSGGKQFSS